MLFLAVKKRPQWQHIPDSIEYFSARASESLELVVNDESILFSSAEKKGRLYSFLSWTNSQAFKVPVFLSRLTEKTFPSNKYAPTSTLLKSGLLSSRGMYGCDCT